MDNSFNFYKKYLVGILLTPVYFWLSHYIAVFPHEYAHSLIANLFGLKAHFWQIDYGGNSLENILFLSHIDENVHYAAMHAANKDWLIALTAFAGPGIGNGLTYVISLSGLKNRYIQSHAWLFYFFFWWHVNSIGNFIDYVPVRTFTTHGDMANLAHGLHISPWWIMLILGYCVTLIVWHFYSKTIIHCYIMLNLSHKVVQALLLFAATLALFGFYAVPGLKDYGAISEFISLLLLWMIIPILLSNWPWRAWVVDRVGLCRLRRSIH